MTSDMPLITEILRGGEQLKLPWSNFEIACMALASSFEAGEGAIRGPETVYELDPRTFECYPDAAFPVTYEIAFMLTDYGALGNTPLNFGAYTLTRRHKFINQADGRILTLLPGDVLRAGRH